VDSSETTLSEECLAKTDEMRSRILKRYGVAIPGILYGKLGTAEDGRSYQITILGGLPERGFVENGKFVHFLNRGNGFDSAQFHPAGKWITDDRDQPSDGQYEIWTPLEWVLRHVQHRVESRLSDFQGHKETAALLDGCKGESATMIRKSPAELTALVRVLRAMLDRHVPILPMDDICAQFAILRAQRIPSPAMVDALSAAFGGVQADGLPELKVADSSA
jgi:flagellar biosynthesis component FlhA